MIWITRAEPGATRTAERLAALGHAPLVAPLIALRPLRVLAGALRLDGVTALAFTSAAGVAAFAGLVAERDRRVYAVGEATAAAARAAGFRDVASADGDGAALAALLAADPARPPGVVLAPGAREPAFDLPAALTPWGVEVRPLALYGATPATEAPAALLQALADRALRGVLLHSAAAARALRGLRARDRRLAVLDATPVYALSEAVAAALPKRGMRLRHVASGPREAELLALLPPPG